MYVLGFLADLYGVFKSSAAYFHH